MADERKAVKYGDSIATEEPAAGLRGILCRSVGGEYFFRMALPDGGFEDIELRHSDLQVTIAANELASIYRFGDHVVLDHDSGSMGLRDVEP